jgi:hypothetical protein
VLEAFAALEPGRAELTRAAHERGWTGVRLDLPLALRFAPRLARVLERVVLVWTVDTDHCRVSLFDPAGGMVEAARPDQVAELVRAFRAARPEYDSGVGLVEWGGSPRQRHAALAAALGVPDTVPGSAWEPGQAPAGQGERRFRRQRRIRIARDVLHLVSGFALIGTLLFVLRPSVAGIVATVVIAGVAQAVRFWLGRIRL